MRMCANCGKHLREERAYLGPIAFISYWHLETGNCNNPKPAKRRAKQP